MLLSTIIYFLGLFKIIKAAITPGIQPQIVKINTIRIDPQPLSITAKGGKRIDSNTLQILIGTNLLINCFKLYVPDLLLLLQWLVSITL